MTEQLRFDEGLRNGAATDGDKWAFSSGAEVMNRVRDQLFAGPALTRDEYRRVDVGYAANEVVDSPASEGWSRSCGRNQQQLLTAAGPLEVPV